MTRETLKVGDRIRFAVSLLEQMHRDPMSHTYIVEIDRLEDNHDGTVEVWLKTVEPRGDDG